MYDGEERWKEEMRWIRRAQEKIAFSRHFLRRLKARRIKMDDIESVIKAGEIIQGHAPGAYERNPDPVRLIIGPGADGRTLHLVVALKKKSVKLVTAYYPDPKIWEEDLRTLKRKNR